MQPTEYRSDAGETSRAIACSGDMYSGVPTVMPSEVSPAWPLAAALAIPKSATFTRPSFVISAFSGLRSRWTIPLRPA
jgi:hypothetical protein